MALSDDLRQRVVDGVVSGDLSRNEAARRFEISIASAVRWVKLYLTTGEISPQPAGGDRRSGRIEAHRAYLLGLIRRAPDSTLLEIQQRLIANCGEHFSVSVLWRFFDRHGITFKKTVSDRTPACGGRNIWSYAGAEGSGRPLFGGIDPAKKRGPWAVADLRMVTPSGDPD
jgi:transposase